MSSSETYAALAPKLFDAGYEVLPILPNRKRPDITGWTDINFRDPQTLDHHIRQCPSYGVGVKTGDVVVIESGVMTMMAEDEFLTNFPAPFTVD